MSLTGFDRLVAEEQKKQSEAAAWDVEREKAEWLEYLSVLYALATEYVQSYVAAGQVVVGYRDITLNEEQVGVYSAREMVITIGTKSIRLEPIGTFIFGSKGRVDVVGALGARAQLLLLDETIREASDMIRVTVTIHGAPPTPEVPDRDRPIEWAWRLLTRPPARRIVALTRDNFLGLLTEIANG